MKLSQGWACCSYSPFRVFIACGVSLLAPRKSGPCIGFKRAQQLTGLALALLSSASVLALAATPATAAELPIFVSPSTIEGIHATRAVAIEGDVSANGSPVTENRIEYSTSENGPFTLAHREPASHSTGGSRTQLTHLSPETTYYVLFSTENSAGTATKLVKFTTPAPQAPELGTLQIPQIGGESGSGFELGATYAAFQADPFSNEPEGPVTGGIETNGAATEYSFEYASSSGGPYAPFPSGATGTVSVAEDFASPTARLSGLTPETTYYVRLKAKNSAGEAKPIIRTFETYSTSPKGETPGVTDLSATSASITSLIYTRGYKTYWRFEYTSEPADPSSWTVTPSAAGTIAATPSSELFASEEDRFAAATITGLNPSATYYVRLHLESEPEGQRKESTSNAQTFETAGKPAVTASAVHTFHAGAIRLLGSVSLNTAPVSERQTVTIEGAPTGGTFTLSFEGHTTQPIPFNATDNTVSHALSAFPGIEHGEVIGNRGGPYTVEFLEANGSTAGQPQLTADGSGLTPSSKVTVATVQSGVSYDTRYRFQYVPQEKFEQTGWTGAEESPEVDLGAGSPGAFATEIVSEDLPGLKPGVAYRYRLLASNTTPGDPQVESDEQVLTVPAAAVEGKEEACPNEALRNGPSGKLPDCRAYEQVTPVDKEGAQNLYRYGGAGTEGNLVGEDGEHFFLHAPGVQLGSSPDPANSNYFFSRTPSGWQMTSARPAGEAGPDSYEPSLFSPDLTQAGLEVGWTKSKVNRSLDVALDTGAPGGPYATVISTSRSNESFWVAASADASKLILETGDHALLGAPTGTTADDDLYEYSEGKLRQLNVSGDSPSATIGSCGAHMVAGFEGYEGGHKGSSSPHAVSADGSRVFFEAVPGATCGASRHLYMRVNGAATIDIGEYTFLAANPEGTDLLLERHSGEAYELFLYDTGTASAKHLLSTRELIAHVGNANTAFVVSEQLTAFYFFSQEQLTAEAPPQASQLGGEGSNVYRYDIPEERLSYVAQSGGNSSSRKGSVSPDGRDFYWEAYSVLGVPGGAPIEGAKPGDQPQQVYRYDSVEGVVQCMSCASPFDPEPKQLATFIQLGTIYSADSVPNQMTASANGDYVFFDTPSALVPRDVDGELKPENDNDKFGTPGYGQYISGEDSPSSDVYEWRRDGIDGCSQIQGCLSLITTGQGGLKNILLGTDASGRDVFFATDESLVSTDDDTSSDVYDARIDGGFPPPPLRPVECEADACSTPFAAPNDLTPSSATFQGAGNLIQPLPVKPAVKSTKPKPKKKKKPSRKKGRKKTKKVKKSNHRRDK